MKGKLTWIAALALALGLIASGCGGDDGNDTESEAGCAEISDDVMAHDGYPAAGSPNQAGDDRDQRGLACPVGAEQSEELPLGERQVDPGQRRQ